MRIRKVSWLFLLSLVSWVAILCVNGQTKPEDEEIRVDTDLVEVPFVVTDRTGKPILNLKKDNFLVF